MHRFGCGSEFFRRVVVVTAVIALAPVARGAEPAGPPRLAVVIVVDQLRGDYLERWEKLFGEGGFRRICTDGAWFQNCHYPYAFTMTGPGHASISTGVSPAKHGIVTNEWYDRAAGREVYCVDSERYERVPPANADPTVPPAKKQPLGLSPERLLAPTVADALKDATGGKGRVVAVSFKDRSAVLMGGRRPDACYWFDTADGQFVTSTYYRDALHSWVKEFNTGRPADRWFGKNWNRLRSDLDYPRHCGPDDIAGEGVGVGQGRRFPHPMDGGQKAAGKKYYDALYNSPFGNELLLDFVKKAVEAERLGEDDTPDLLCVSFSSNDIVGHCWGPDSHEVLDTTLRTDLILKGLLDYLDTRVGKGRYVLALSADHGICPLPEVARGQGKDAGFVSPSLLTSQADDFLQETFGKKGEKKSRWVESDAGPGPWVYFNRAVLKDHGVEPADAEAALVRWLRQQAGVQAAYGRSQLADLPKGDVVGAAVRRSFHPDRCGDVAVVLKPHYLMSGKLTGTTHGTPHPYDTHVPLVVFGPGVKPGARKEPVTPQAVAVILARALGMELPKDAEAAVPEGLFERR
ncbi:MAG: alkaline phosphatase family protein [Planctomycetes bacterium]|nr:alkaline phosphatase family protein [Planctomycetota bacterium]